MAIKFLSQFLSKTCSGYLNSHLFDKLYILRTKTCGVVCLLVEVFLPSLQWGSSITSTLFVHQVGRIRAGGGGGGTASLKVGTRCKTTAPAFWGCPPLTFP